MSLYRLQENPEYILYAVLVFAWLEFAWESYLGSRQRKVYAEHVKPPAEVEGLIDDETYEKARVYALDKSKFGAVQDIFVQLVSTAILWLFALRWAWKKSSAINLQLFGTESEILNSATFFFLSNVFNMAVGLPFSVYNTFVLEQKHGFNKQTASFYVKDQIKKFVVGQVISLPLMAAIVKIILWGGDYFFVYMWAFVVFFTLFMMVVYPDFIAPLFDKYTPLPDGDLRQKIEKLAAGIDFPLYKLFVVEGSKRSSHSNAYFYGFFKFKRIVLFDTLLEESERRKLKDDKDDEEEEGENSKAKGCNTEEILAVLGHELGHWKLNHVLKNLVISEVHIFLMFAAFGYLYNQQVLYAAFGFERERPAIIGLVVILQFIAAPYNALLNFAMTVLSRRFEFQADHFAAAVLGRSQSLQSALVKLNNDNLGFPIFDRLYSAWHHSHPPLLERLAVMKSKKD